MKINRTNIEEIFLDYLDERLNPEEIAALMAYLSENPDLEEEFEALKESQILDEYIPFDNKNELKRDLNSLPVTPVNLEEFFIAYHENDLTKESKAKLHNYLKLHPEKEKIFYSVGRLRLIPEKNISCPEKRKLKKTTPTKTRTLLLRYTSVAAILIIGIFILLKINRVENTLPNTESTKVVTISEGELPRENIDIDEKKPTYKSKPDESRLLSSNIEKKQTVITESKELEIEVTRKKIEILPQLQARDILISNKVSENIIIKTTETKKVNYSVLHTTTSGQPSKPTIINLITKGIEGINTFTESEIVLETKTDSNGKIESLALYTPNFEIKKKFRSR